MRKKSDAWSRGDADNWDKRRRAMIIAALNESGQDRKVATDLFEETVVALAGAGDMAAQAELFRWQHVGAKTDVDSYASSKDGRLQASLGGASGRVDVPAGKAVSRRNADGDEIQLVLPMLDFAFAELELKLMEVQAQDARLIQSVRVIRRFLELHAEVPEAKTPREALAKLGMTAEAWLELQL